MKKMYAEHCAEKLRYARNEAGYTQTQIAELTGISQPNISRIEKGTRKPSIEDLCTLIDFYEYSADWILGTGKNRK